MNVAPPSGDAGSPAPARLPLTFVVITLLLDAMGIGLILPVLPLLIEEVQGAGLGRAALWGGVMATGFAVMQFLCGPALGQLSDRVGRRPVLLVSLAAMAIYYLAMAVAGSVWTLLAARLFGGITAATQAVAAAMLADLSPDDRKSQNFGLIGAAFGVGFVLGPVIGGLLGEFGPRAPFLAAAALAAANLAFGAVVLRETVAPDARRPFRPRRANPFAAFRHIGDLPGVQPLLILFFLFEFAFTVYPAIWAFYTLERYGWSPSMTGASLAAFGIGLAIVQGGLIRWLIPKFGEVRVIVWGLAYNVVAFLTIAAISDGRLGLSVVALTALGAVVTPALQGRMSKGAGADRQGELQGVISAARAVAMIFAPLVMTRTFFVFTDGGGLYLPGAAFVLSAMLMALCLAYFLRLRAASSV